MKWRRFARRARALIGVISDTHGLLRPEACAALEGVDLIIHAGDIGALGVIDELEQIAPVLAVRGNVDRGSWAERFAEVEVAEVCRRHIYVLHSLHDLDLDPRAAGFEVVVSGHSHAPLIDRRDGVLYVNPGSAGPRRFRLPVALARIAVSTDTIAASIETLELAGGAAFAVPGD